MSLPSRPLLTRRTTNRPNETSATAPLLSDVGGDSGRAPNLDSNLSSDFDLGGAARDEEFLDDFSFNDMLQQNDEVMQANDSATVLSQLDSCVHSRFVDVTSICST